MCFARTAPFCEDSSIVYNVIDPSALALISAATRTSKFMMTCPTSHGEFPWSAFESDPWRRQYFWGLQTKQAFVSKKLSRDCKPVEFFVLRVRAIIASSDRKQHDVLSGRFLEREGDRDAPSLAGQIGFDAKDWTEDRARYFSFCFAWTRLCTNRFWSLYQRKTCKSRWVSAQYMHLVREPFVSIWICSIWIRADDAYIVGEIYSVRS